ncbi:MAG: adenylate kinase [Elusimicrobiota bacterium]
MKIVLLGCPGAGKGTQSMFLCRKYGLEHVSTGDIFREEMGKESAVGKKVADYVKRGELVPDDLVVKMVAAHLDSGSGEWLLDGFPRTLGQARELDKYLQAKGQKLNAVLYLSLELAEVVERLSGRRTCSGCGDVYNLISRPPQVEGKCDKCGKALVQREDDMEETIKNRLQVYEEQTAPLAAYYRENSDFAEVDGAGDFPEVARALYESIDKAAAGSGL